MYMSRAAPAGRESDAPYGWMRASRLSSKARKGERQLACCGNECSWEDALSFE